MKAGQDNHEKPSTHHRRNESWFARREPLVAFLLGAVAMSYVQWGTYEPAGRDSFYHIKMAVLLPEIGFPEHFHWLRHTILNDRNVSHHHGFHMMMVPFVYGSKWVAELMPEGWHQWASQETGTEKRTEFAVALRSWLQSPYILGGKVFDVLLFAVVVLIADLIMRRLDVGFRWFWLLAILALPTDFFLRMSYIRAPAASLAILLLVFYCCTLGRYIWVGLLGSVYCHIYGGFVFYPIVVAIVASCYATLGRDWRRCVFLIVACAVGLAIGLLTHPYFPENVSFLWVQLFETGLQTGAVEKVTVGSEWKPINIDYFLQISAFTLFAFGLTLMIRLTWRRLREPETMALLVLNAMFLGLCLWARRFIEYWPIFCLLSSASLWRGFEASAWEIVSSISATWSGGDVVVRAVYKRVYVALCAGAMAVAGFTLGLTREAAKCKFDIPNIKRAMTYLRENTPQGSLIFTDDWDEFPLYFYYNHHNDYVCGLDPQFTNSKDPVLWERFCVITQGRSPRSSTVKVLEESPRWAATGVRAETFMVEISDIKTHFQADYVLVDKSHQPFYRKLKAKPSMFKHVYPPTSREEPPSRVASLAVFEVIDGPQKLGEGPPVSRETGADFPVDR